MHYMKIVKSTCRQAKCSSGGLEDYQIPGIADTPIINVQFDEGGFDHVLGGSVGIGEVATCRRRRQSPMPFGMRSASGRTRFRFGLID